MQQIDDILAFNVSGSRAWCKLAYGELRDRVGAEFPVYAPSVDVFSGSHLPKGSGLDLERIFEVRPRHGKDVANTREKIGQGGCELVNCETVIDPARVKSPDKRQVY